MMKRRAGFAILAAALTASASQAASAPPNGMAELRPVASIAIPGEAFGNFDIATVDQARGRLYVADRSNKAVDVFDTTADSYLGRAGGFVGVLMKNGKAANAVSARTASWWRATRSGPATATAPSR